VDAHVGDARRAADAEGGLDPFAVAGLGEGDGGVAALGDVDLPLEEHLWELLSRRGGVGGGESGRVERGGVDAWDLHDQTIRILSA
jgi:hypothetical protein